MRLKRYRVTCRHRPCRCIVFDGEGSEVSYDETSGGSGEMCSRRSNTMYIIIEDPENPGRRLYADLLINR